jgi:hypothetical protein
VYIYKSFARAAHTIIRKENRNIIMCPTEDLPSAARNIYSVIMFSMRMYSDNAPARISSFIHRCERTKKIQNTEEINARGWVIA